MWVMTEGWTVPLITGVLFLGVAGFLVTRPAA
jgi:hypothetical protein